MKYRLLCAVLTLGFTLACAGSEDNSGGDDAKETPAEETPAKESPKPAGPATWWVDGKEAKGPKLVGAVMDLWGGDPGLICFKGDSKAAVKKAKKAFSKSDDFVSAKADASSVTITTKSPFGDGSTSPSKFETCP